MRGLCSRDSANRSRVGGILGFGALVMLVASTGCRDSSTQPVDTASPSTLSLNEVTAQVGLSSDQAAALAPAHGAWQRDEASWSLSGGNSGEPPVLDFLAASASVLDRGQMRRLATAVHVYEAGRVSIPVDDPLLGPPGHGPGMGGGMGGHGRRGHGPGHPGGPGGPGDPFRDLGLTPAQVEQLRAARQVLMTTVHDLVEQLRAGTITPAGFEAGVEAARGGFETSVQTILTPAQYAQLQAVRRDRLIMQLTQRLATFDANVTRHVGALDRILDLSDSQAAGITAILTNAKPAVEAVLAGLQDNSLTPQAAHAQLKQIAVGNAAAIRLTLTPEQAALFDTLMHLRRLFPGCRP